MAEFGIVASVIQIADVGLRLSLRLYTFGETVASADRTILSISKDISLTSSVLQELGHSLKKDKAARICSENAIRTADEVVQECLKIFEEIDGLMKKSAARIGSEGKPKVKWTSAMVGKLKWPFLQPKMQLLRSNLDRLKATLLLMLNVMIYARQVSEKQIPNELLEGHRRLIEDIARSREEYTRKFETLALAIRKTSFDQVVREPHDLDAFTRPRISSDPSKIPPPLDLTNHTFYEMQHYGNLINRLLGEISAAEYGMEPVIGPRIWDDIVISHWREADRLRSLHGRKLLKAAITGVAWDLVKALSETGESDPSSATSISEGSSECMDRTEADMQEVFYEFEVEESDKWLPVANVARIMKAALPEHAKIKKDTKECMQECVSEFISFITSEAAEMCTQHHMQMIEAEAILESMVNLSFENYAEALKIHLARYRQVSADAIKLSSAPPSIVGRDKLLTEPSCRPELEVKRDEPTDIQVSSDDKPVQRYGDDHLVKDNEDRSKHDAALRTDHQTQKQTTSIVDDLLSQWTTLTK